MDKFIDLPILEPLYCTYHYTIPSTAVLTANPSIKNWYLSQIFMIYCTRKFLSGYTTPQLNIHAAEFLHNPYLERKKFFMRDLKGCINTVIKNLLDNGFYVYFMGVDDYYIEGKTFYKEKHFEHDGLICGYDSKNKTFTYKPDEVDFVGDEDELINFLETNKSKQQSIMRWNCNGIYYASFYNKVIKSKNKSVVDKYFDVLKKSYNNDELGYNPFLEIKDLDSNTYEIQTPLVVIKGQGLKNAIAKYQESLLRSGNEQVFLNKLENGQDVFIKYKEEIESVKKQAPWPMMILPRKYVGLSKGEYNQLVLLVKKEKGIFGVKEINPEEPDL